MTKVYAGKVEFESIEDYLAAMEAQEQRRAPFKAEAETLADEFIDYLDEQGLSKRTIRKHGQNIEIFIVYLTQYTDADDFATVRKGVVNTEFFRWYRRKVLNRLDQASRVMKQCLATMSSEDLDFRALVNQQLYQVHKRLARSGIRAGDKSKELANGLGMSRTVTTLANELETAFALSEAYQRKGEFSNAALQLRSVVGTYGHYEYPIPSLLSGDMNRLRKKQKD